MMPMKHSIYDTDTRYSIDPITRKFKNKSSTKTTLIQGDHNSERFTFEIPRYVEGHDMSLCDKVEVNYINVDSKTKGSNKGLYIVDDVQVSSEDENIVIFSWLVSGNATMYSGGLSFLITFKCFDPQDNTKISYSWNTSIYTGISISDGMSNTEFIVEEYIDVLEQWKQELIGLKKQSDWNQNDETADDYIKNRPFYCKSEVFTFPDAYYEAPSYSADRTELYTISSKFPVYDSFDGFMVTAHVQGDESTTDTIEVITEGDNANSYVNRNDDTGEIVTVIINNIFVILYSSLPMDQDGTVIVPPGVYLMTESYDRNIIVLDSIESVDIKKIDTKFIPELDYTSTEDGNQIRNSAQNALNIANQAYDQASQAKTAADNAQTTASQAQTTASQAKTAADNAQTTASQAKTTASQAKTTASQAKTAADNAQTTASQAKTTALSVKDATKLFYRSGFSKTPFRAIGSLILNSTFLFCSSMEKCNIETSSYAPSDITALFNGCKKLTTIGEVAYSFDLKNVVEAKNARLAFYNCISLTTIVNIKNIKVSIDFSYSPLDDDTVNGILDALIEGTETQTLTFNSEITSNLTDEQYTKLPSNWQLG